MPFSYDAVDNAFHHLCRTRRHQPSDADIWHLRFFWPRERQRIYNALQAGTWCLDPLSVVRCAADDRVAIWSAADAIVIHCLTQWLNTRLPTHPACEHVRGHGGGQASLVRLHRLVQARTHTFVCRTDIRGYYASIDKTLLMHQLRGYVDNPHVLALLHQFVHYSVVSDGEYHTPVRGIARGSALSPLLAAFHLYALDQAMTDNPHVHYVRYMDDILIFTRSRWHLRHAVRQLNHFFTACGFEQHPDKTFIGRVDKGFDWMGVLFTAHGATTVAPRAIANHLLKLRRLYEQALRNNPPSEVAHRVAAYRVRWARHFRCMLPDTLSATCQVLRTA